MMDDAFDDLDQGPAPPFSMSSLIPLTRSTLPPSLGFVDIAKECSYFLVERLIFNVKPLFEKLYGGGTRKRKRVRDRKKSEDAGDENEDHFETILDEVTDSLRNFKTSINRDAYVEDMIRRCLRALTQQYIVRFLEGSSCIAPVWKEGDQEDDDEGFGEVFTKVRGDTEKLVEAFSDFNVNEKILTEAKETLNLLESLVLV